MAGDDTTTTPDTLVRNRKRPSPSSAENAVRFFDTILDNHFNDSRKKPKTVIDDKNTTPLKNILRIWLDMRNRNDYEPIFIQKLENHKRRNLIPHFPLMTNSVIQYNCRGLRPNFDELSILIVKHNPLAVCLQETFLKDTDNITSITNARKLKIEPLGVFQFLLTRMSPRV